jgi:hypothetical protein
MGEREEPARQAKLTNTHTVRYGCTSNTTQHGAPRPAARGPTARSHPMGERARPATTRHTGQLDKVSQCSVGLQQQHRATPKLDIEVTRRPARWGTNVWERGHPLVRTTQVVNLPVAPAHGSAPGPEIWRRNVTGNVCPWHVYRTSARRRKPECSLQGALWVSVTAE